MNELIKKLLDEIATAIKCKDLGQIGVPYSKVNGEFFEEVFKTYCEQALEKTEYTDIKLEDIRGQKFPDFSLNIEGSKFGVEIKSSEKGNWTVPGNSVYESTSATGYENIFIFFGSYKVLENSFEVFVGDYWKAVKDIKVTHSPRFEISVNQERKNDFFDNWESFTNFRNMKKSEKTEILQQFLRNKKKGQNLWYVPSGEPEQLSPKLFEELDTKIQDDILAKSFILFPSDIFKAKETTKNGNITYTMDSFYGNISKYFIEEYFVHSPSVRDKFSSGGRKGLEKESKPPLFPAVFKRFSKLGILIYTLLEQIDNGEQGDFKEQVLFAWNNRGITYINNSFLESYKNHLDSLENSPNLQYIIRKELDTDVETHVLSSQIKST